MSKQKKHKENKRVKTTSRDISNGEDNPCRQSVLSYKDTTSILSTSGTRFKKIVYNEQKLRK
jgi:hypothetical protein